MKRVSFSFIFVLFLSCLVFAESQIVSVEVDASGISEAQAIANGLQEAVRQITGTQLNSQQEIATLLSQNRQSTNGEATSQIESQQQTAEEIKLSTNGLVKSYEILDRDCDDGIWNVRLRVDIVNYQTPGISPDSRRKLAVLPFAARSTSYTVGSGTLSGTSVADNLLSNFNKFFTQSRRFTVLSRIDQSEINQEKRLISSESPIEELAKLGQTRGADYLIVGSIKEFYIAPATLRTIQISGAQTIEIERAYADLDYRVIVPATSQIKWADRIQVDLSQQEIAMAGGDEVTLYNLLSDYISRKLAADTLDAIYPLKILKLLENGELVLDRGGALMQIGAAYDVFKLGEEIINPSNGESLGCPEIKIATVQVTRVDQKLSYALPIQGYGTITAQDVDNGLIMRLYRPELDTTYSTQAPEPAPAPAKPVIKLPFDN